MHVADVEPATSASASCRTSSRRMRPRSSRRSRTSTRRPRRSPSRRRRRRKSPRPRATRRWRPRPQALAEAMAPAAPAPVEPEREILDDEYLEIARNLERGMWIEFEADDGQLAFAKLAWVSPLRGTYLFTNRQGQKALSMTAEELAERFPHRPARLVEAEPLIDRAFSSMMAQMEDKFAGTAHASHDGRVDARPDRRALRRDASIGALIIGDEILTGKRQDRHLPHVDRDARRARPRARLRALRRRRSRPAHGVPARFVRARRPRVQLRRHRRDARTITRGRRRPRRSACRSCGIPEAVARLERAVRRRRRIRTAC